MLVDYGILNAIYRIMPNSVVLHSYWRSSCSWRVRIALHLKNVAYEYKAVNLLKGEQRSAEYLALNPSGLVPTLDIDGAHLTESMAILEYLDEIYPKPAILPESPVQRAKVRTLSLQVVAMIQPFVNLAVQRYYSEDEAKRVEWSKHWITNGFKVIEKNLQTMAGKYCVGDEITMADICLVPQLYGARRFGVDMTAFPTICAIESRLAEHPAFRAADASRQPDTPESDRAKD